MLSRGDSHQVIVKINISQLFQISRTNDDENDDDYFEEMFILCYEKDDCIDDFNDDKKSRKIMTKIMTGWWHWKVWENDDESDNGYQLMIQPTCLIFFPTQFDKVQPGYSCNVGGPVTGSYEWEEWGWPRSSDNISCMTRSF